jgi:conjugal transfer pilus assembly protein TraB
MANPPPSRIAGAISRLSPKHRQYLILGLGIGAFLLLVFGGVAIWDKPVQLPQGSNPSRPQPMPIATPGAQADPRDIWMSKSAEQMRQMEDMIQGLRQQVDTLDKKPASVLPPALTLPPPPPPAPMPAQAPMPPLPPPLVPTALNGTKEDRAMEPPPPPRPPGIASFEVSDARVAAQESAVKPDVKRDARSYVPSGSFFRAALLGGLDAPTGGQAQSNPHPILMRVQDNAFLPNRYRFKIKECLVLGASHGDISSERAYIRLESLSCIRHDGKAIDVPVKGLCGWRGRQGRDARASGEQARTGAGQCAGARHRRRHWSGVSAKRDHGIQPIRSAPSAPSIRQAVPGRYRYRCGQGAWIACPSTTSRWPRRCFRSSRSMPDAPWMWCSPRASRWRPKGRRSARYLHRHLAPGQGNPEKAA